MKELNETTYHALLEQLWRKADSQQFEQPEDIHELQFLSEFIKGDLTYFKQAALTESGEYKATPSDSREDRSDSPREWLRIGLQRVLKDRGFTDIDATVFEKLLTDYLDIHIHRTQKQLDSLNPEEYKPKLPAFLQPKPMINTTQNDAISSLLLSEAWKTFVNEKKFGSTPLEDVPKSAQPLTPSSVNQRMTNLSEFFKWLVTEEYLLKNPFEGINVEANKKSYATYTNDDLKTLFNLDKKRISTSWQFWIPIIALFSGARQNEIAQLQVSDVIKDVDSGTWYFSINDNDVKKHVKSKSARRKVPIHNDLPHLHSR
ncbi:MAG: hypothetical protein JKY52_08850 [Flavobacteriales bacterium]|nr:hypothetical protein [Flavobacteriales bacterium]